MSSSLDTLSQTLQVANTSALSDSIYKELLEICFIELIDLESKSISHLYNSKPDLIKELQANFLTAIAEFARNSFTKDAVNQFLKNKCKYADERATYFSNLYDKYFIQLQVKMGNIGSHLPSIVDVDIKIKPLITVEDPEAAIFQVSLLTEKFDETSQSKKVENVDFACTKQEMLDLLWKLKDISRHCFRIANEG